MNNLKPCPACGSEFVILGPVATPFPVSWDDSPVRGQCRSSQCRLLGPANDPDGAKWNAMPRPADVIATRIEGLREGASQARVGDYDSRDSEMLLDLRGAIDDHLGWENSEDEAAGDYIARVKQVDEALAEAKRKGDGTMTLHTLKTIEPFWSDVRNGLKTFEVRRDDRGFRVGDTVRLVRHGVSPAPDVVEWCERRISYILEGGRYGIASGHVVLGLETP